MRHIRNATTAAATLLCVLALLAWFATALGLHAWRVVQGPPAIGVASVRDGNLWLHLGDFSPDPERPATWRWQHFGKVEWRGRPIVTLDDASIWSRLGLIRTLEFLPYRDGVLEQDPRILHGVALAPSWCRSLVLPLWLVALVSAVAPARRAVAAARRRRRTARMRRGQCPACGYDLRVAGERCPECGEPRATLAPDAA